MKILDLHRHALSLSIAVAMLAGCGGAQPPVGAPGTMPPSTALAEQDLLYVAGGCGGTCVFAYPTGKRVGSLSLSGLGLCSDKHGNIFMPSSTSSGQAVVYEYAHGGTSPFATLSVPGLLAEGCSVDPTTGNLAVTYLCKNCDYGPVAIFQNAQGSPTSYQATGVFLSYCGYDNKGNLFADGMSGSKFVLEELPKGGSSLTTVSVNQNIVSAGQVQWDGTYLAIEDLVNPVIYQFKVSGSTATRVGTTHLTGTGSSASSSWIYAGTVIVPFGQSTNPPKEVGFWKYPAGGAATKIIKKHINASYLEGATISLAPHS
jgi:hypothetical protein